MTKEAAKTRLSKQTRLVYYGCSLKVIACHPPPPPLGSSISVKRVKSSSVSLQGSVELTFLSSRLPQDLPTAHFSILATETVGWKSGGFHHTPSQMF